MVGGMAEVAGGRGEQKGGGGSRGARRKQNIKMKKAKRRGSGGISQNNSDLHINKCIYSIYIKM